MTKEEYDLNLALIKDLSKKRDKYQSRIEQLSPKKYPTIRWSVLSLLIERFQLQLEVLVHELVELLARHPAGLSRTGLYESLRLPLPHSHQLCTLLEKAQVQF